MLKILDLKKMALKKDSKQMYKASSVLKTKKQ